MLPTAATAAAAAPPLPLQEAGTLDALPPPDEANTESFLESFVEPQRGHVVPFHLLERTNISLSCSHFSQ
jgi:hypothetical protein